MSKEFISLGSPDGIRIDLPRSKENDAYEEATKGFIHAIIVPFILMWIHPLVASAYFAAVSFLYLTVFRSKSQGYWRVVTLILMIGVLLIIA